MVHFSHICTQTKIILKFEKYRKPFVIISDYARKISYISHTGDPKLLKLIIIWNKSIKLYSLTILLYKDKTIPIDL